MLTIKLPGPFDNIYIKKIYHDTTNWSYSMIVNNDHSLTIVSQSGGYMYLYTKVKTYQWHMWNILKKIYEFILCMIDLPIFRKKIGGVKN